MRKLNLLVILVFLFSILTHAQKKADLAVSPPMGWNSWNWHGKKEINEQVVRETIDAMLEEGLVDSGYNYIVIDGGWRDTLLGDNGQLLSHPVKFPNGIKPLADYAHSKGLKLGVHVVPGTLDCGGDPVGGFNKEEVHLKQFEDWGLDFIKLDLCKQTEDPCETCEKSKSGWSEQTIEATYWKWSQLFNKSKSDILFSISAYKYRDWYPKMCNMARTTGDIQCRIHKEGALFNPDKNMGWHFRSVMEIAELNNKAADWAGNGYWNDPDMMVTGEHGLSEKEQESHFALWCIMSSPLFLGNDPRNMSPIEKKLILNKKAIFINQDLTEQGRIIKRKGETQVWAKKMQNGNMAILFLNLDKSGEKKIQIKFKELGLKGNIKVIDVLANKDLGMQKKLYSKNLQTNECVFLELSQE